jgi:RNA polymerase sigma-70 factor (ECF subfamily)
MSSDGDRLLIQQIRQGDQRAWQNLIARYEGRLLAFVERRLHDHAASEDVVQETFIGFLSSLPHFDERRELQTYLFTIASHKLTDYLRRSGRHPLHPASDSEGGILQQQLDPHAAASSLARSQERRELESEAITSPMAGQG